MSKEIPANSLLAVTTNTAIISIAARMPRLPPQTSPVNMTTWSLVPVLAVVPSLQD
jgi:hypothetical protein